MVQCSLPALDCGSMGKDKQGVMRHYTGGGGKHNILKMWVDDFMQSWAVKSVPKVVGQAGAEVLASQNWCLQWSSPYGEWRSRRMLRSGDSGRPGDEEGQGEWTSLAPDLPILSSCQVVGGRSHSQLDKVDE